ncbi:hypothetical protein QEG73_12925 [Chitinophagaceae bacterium 26-R-25]|nr:hypothetical protein [Chitinophagaceae bacterium 26-R-25]
MRRTLFLFIQSNSILLPLIPGLLRFPYIEKSYRPFIVLLLIGFINEIISFISISIFKTNEVSSNLYLLAEAMFLFYQFHVWGFLKSKDKAFYLFTGLFAIVWIVEEICFGQIASNSRIFVISYSFAVTLLGINQINYIIIHEDRRLLRNGRFILCMGFIIFYIYQILYEGALYVNPYLDDNLETSNLIILFFGNLNFFVNILYAIAVFLIPVEAKLPFTLEKLNNMERG